MKCYECKWSKKSRSKIHKYYCTKFRVHAQDHLSGCKDGEEKEKQQE